MDITGKNNYIESFYYAVILSNGEKLKVPIYLNEKVVIDLIIGKDFYYFKRNDCDHSYALIIPKYLVLYIRLASIME